MKAKHIPLLVVLGTLGASATAAWSPVSTSGGVFIDPPSLVDLGDKTWAVRYRIDKKDGVSVVGRAVIACSKGQHRLAGGEVKEADGTTHEFAGSAEWKTLTKASTAGNDIHRFVCAMAASGS